MLAKILSGANIGLEAVPITVEVDIASQGLPSFTIVGLGDRAVEEAKERVRSAIRNSGADFPARKITVNLAPADLPKEGPVFDLPIALGLLIASGQISQNQSFLNLTEALVMGELSLDGSLRKTAGVLPAAIMAQKNHLESMLVPFTNAQEAAVIEGIKVFAFEKLQEIIKVFLGQSEAVAVKSIPVDFSTQSGEYDFYQIKGQEQAKRALEIAAAGGHNILLKGPPGAGKTMLARAFSSIMPPLSFNESLEVTSIYSIAGILEKDRPLMTARPFRTPHHTASYVGMVGGGASIKPGEISLAHRGVLFLDELPEFPRLVLESLRQPMEDRKITISRANGSLTFPAQFILLAAQNPCPCGFLGDKKHQCNCMPGSIAKYQRRLSGPLLDRIDIYLEVPAVEVEKLSDLKEGESSEVIRGRVVKAREIQGKRFRPEDGEPLAHGGKILTNAEMGNLEIRQYCQITQEALELLKRAISSLNLSARAYHRVLKLSRTIADLAGVESILTEHIAEALQYRSREDS